MRSLRKRDHGPEKVELNMTPMIDVVFQLLTFFALTLKPVLLEGDFNIDMPSASQKPGIPDVELKQSMKLVMKADAEGKLTTMTLDNRPVANLEELRSLVAGRAAPSTPGKTSDAEIELTADFHLKYRHVIEAIDHVAGTKTSDGTVVPLISNLKFTPPKEGPRP